MIHFIYIIILIYFNSTIGYINNAQWLALQMAWFAQWIHRCTLVVAKVRVWFLVKHKFVQLFFNHLGCSFYCKRSSWLSYFTNATFPKAFQTAQNFFQLGDKKVTKEFFLRASYSVGFRVKKWFFLPRWEKRMTVGNSMAGCVLKWSSFVIDRTWHVFLLLLWKNKVLKGRTN